VGGANAAIGIHTGRQDSVPMVAIVGGVKRAQKGREAFQESDLVGGIGSLGKRALEPSNAAEAVRHASEGLRAMGSGRPGPLVLVLPEDLLDERVSGEVTPAPAASHGPAADRSAVRQVLRWLAASERGVILAGGGVLRARASKRLVALAEALGVPVIASWRRPDVFPNDHPNFLGMTGYWAAPTVRQRLLDADVLLVLGARLSEVASFGYRVPARGTRWAHVDLEPRRAGAGLPAPTLSVAADASRFLDAAWSDLRGAALDAEMRDRRLVRLAEDRAAYLDACRVDRAAWEGPGVHPGRVVAALQRLLPANAIITTDAGNFAGWAARGYRFRRPGTFLGPTSGAMGYGLPAAIAASILHPDRPVVALAGDGGFAMTMAELETAVREGARPIAVVFDNGHYGTIRMHQEREGRAITASDLGPIDFAAVARACGALGFTVTDDAGIEPALTEALASGRTAVIHLSLDRRWVSVDQTP
jgi:acetolactate synthase I/II/III large subunit